MMTVVHTFNVGYGLIFRLYVFLYMLQCSRTDSWETSSIVCQPGYEVYDNSCYKVLGGNGEEFQYEEAVHFCQLEGADLADIFSDAENEAVLSMVNGRVKGSSAIWLGLHDRNQGNGGEYIWQSGAYISYTNWGAYQPSKSPQGGCVAMDMSTGYWSDQSCGQNLTFTICKNTTDALPTAPPMLPGTCENGWVEGSGWCYFFEVAVFLPWTGASSFCQEEGGELVSLHSLAEANFVLDTMEQQLITPLPFWTGLSVNDDKRLMWSDNSTVEFVDWAPGEPDEDPSLLCVQYFQPAAHLQWSMYTVECNKENYFVCKAQPNSILSATTNVPRTSPEQQESTIELTSVESVTPAGITSKQPSPIDGTTTELTISSSADGSTSVTHHLYTTDSTQLTTDGGNPTSDNGLTSGDIVGIVFGVAVLVIFIAGCALFLFRRFKTYRDEEGIHLTPQRQTLY